jgi:uncharacterized protein
MAGPRRARDPILGVGTSVAAFVGSVPGPPPADPVLVTSVAEFARVFGSIEGETADAVWLFFENGGRRAYVAGFDEAHPLRSLDALALTPFNILVVPATARPLQPWPTSLGVAAALLAEKRGALYVADPPAERTASNVARWAGSVGSSRSTAVYFPRLRVRRPSGERDLPSGGAVAGILARIDLNRGVWASPDGEHVAGVLGPAVELDVARVDTLGLAAVNAIRFVPGRGIRLWGARTLADTDDEWKYIHVRRLAAFLEQSIEQGLQWVVFEPNAARLWTQVRALIRTFLSSAFRSGAFPATTPEDAFFVRCDRTTMTQDDIDSGRLVVEIGIAPIRPAEFVIFRIGLWARSPGRSGD